MKLFLPEGRSVVLQEPKDSRESLAEWLGASGFGLNTRCGGRGLCRGCQVQRLRGNEPPELVKACQVRAFEAAGEVRIPRQSLADESLSGVSAFDLRRPRDVPRLRAEGVGLAIDIGTTTLAAALWDLSTDRSLGTATRANPQRRFGDDVLSRISFSLEQPDGRVRLQHSLVRDGLRPLIAEVLQAADLPVEALSAIVAAGNPTMLQTLTGDALDGLARYPFRLAWSGERTIPATEVGLNLPVTLRLLPALGPFVGSDIVAGAFASGLPGESRSTLLMDFGTNGEMLLLHQGRALATAVAAGPAFEGGRLRCGTTARPDAVSAIELADMEWRCLDGRGEPTAEARGLSGAAYIDFLALGVEAGLLNAFGRMDRTHPLWHKFGEIDDDEAVLRLGRNLVISEADIAELLQAKAAFGAGIRVLLAEAGLVPRDLERVLIAGGFGYHLSPAHARAVGLLPDLPLERFEIIGNASLAGASLSLQFDLAQHMESLRRACRVIELNQIPAFSACYADALLLEPLEP
ncbi:MAG: DUF4445 domain-containing protein [Opitutales bacterium]|nr:DUF4445 domain-containing protein [Opitutales bacterium]